MPEECQAEPVVAYQWTVHVRAKPTAGGQYDDAVLSDPLQVFEVSTETAASRSKDLCSVIKPGRYYRIRFKDYGVRMVHESWVQWPRAPKQSRVTDVTKLAAEVASDIPRHRKAEAKAREEVAGQALPVGMPTTKPKRGKWRRIRSV